MKLYEQSNDLSLYYGNNIDVLKTIEADSVDCVVTSPPYWGLRDYGTSEQLGTSQVKQTVAKNNGAVVNYSGKRNNVIEGLKEKDLVGIPWQVAFALQADGWYLRSDIIWQKPNPMPESVKDRPTKSHEYIFLLTKSKKYYYDADAIKEMYGVLVPSHTKKHTLLCFQKKSQ